MWHQFTHGNAPFVVKYYKSNENIIISMLYDITCTHGSSSFIVKYFKLNKFFIISMWYIHFVHAVVHHLL